MTYTKETSYKDGLIKWLNEYIGVLEEAIEKDIDFLDTDNYENYKEAIATFNAVSDKPYRNHYIMGLIEDKLNELPY